MTQQNNQPNKKFKLNKKILGIVGTITIGLFAFTYLSVKSNVKTNEEKVAENLQREVPANVSNVGVDDKVLNMEATGEQGEKIRQLDNMAASEAAANMQSYVALPPNSQSEQSNINTTNNNIVQPIPAEQPIENISQSTNNTQPMTVNYQQPVMAAPVIPEPKVYEITIRKEIPVARYEPYTFTKDTGVLSHFVNLYGGNLGTGQGQGQMNVNGVQTKDLDARYRQQQIQKKQQEEQAKQQNQQVQQGQANQENQNQKQTTTQEENTVAVNKVGDVIASELETNIDSRRPTLVRATIAEGVLRGSTVVGSFSKNGDGTSVIIEFTSLNVPGLPRSIPIKAVAVDLINGTNAMATSVNKHAVTRVSFAVLETMAAAFANNLSTNNQNYSQRTVTDTATGNTSTVTVNNTTKKTNKEILKESAAVGISSALTEIDDLVPREPTVKVEAMPFGLFITEDLLINKQDAYELGLY